MWQPWYVVVVVVSSFHVKPLGIDGIACAGWRKIVIGDARVCVQCSLFSEIGDSLFTSRSQKSKFLFPESNQYLCICTIAGYPLCSCNFENPFIWIYIFDACLPIFRPRQCFNLFRTDHRTIHQIRCQVDQTEAFSFDTFTTFFQIWNHESEIEKLEKSA